jgi:tetratricopeptide (TPR) repeat protein
MGENMRKWFSLTFVSLTIMASTGLAWGQLAPAIKPLSGSKGAAQINKGVESSIRGNWSEAQKHYKEALTYNLALAYENNGDSQNALIHFQKASAYGQLNPWIRNSKVLNQRLKTK